MEGGYALFVNKKWYHILTVSPTFSCGKTEARPRFHHENRVARSCTEESTRTIRTALGGTHDHNERGETVTDAPKYLKCPMLVS